MEKYKELNQDQLIELRDYWMQEYADIGDLVRFIVDNFGTDDVVNRRNYRIWTGAPIPGMTDEMVFDLILTRQDILEKSKKIGALYSAFENVLARKDVTGWTFRKFDIMMNLIASDEGKLTQAENVRAAETGEPVFQFITPGAWAKKVLAVFPELKKEFSKDQDQAAIQAKAKLYGRLNLDKADDFRKGK